ncbi:hypothetical protein H359_0688 [Chlamydia ibidis 10-1398/6]|uniref:Uncharacterized protein n=1 Tax=Chlamydia ibidis 10-1398/6 TaxID=1046581 RepID=A0ABN0MZL4_9CHLA|nr:hypothetical protein H359_0688 [Chlamydia ibidis 10-1398/6]
MIFFHKLSINQVYFKKCDTFFLILKKRYSHPNIFFPEGQIPPPKNTNKLITNKALIFMEIYCQHSTNCHF